MILISTVKFKDPLEESKGEKSAEQRKINDDGVLHLNGESSRI